MTDKQYHLIISMSEKVNTTAKHKELLRSNIQKLSMEQIDYLIKDLKDQRTRVPYDVWMENKRISESPDIDMQDYLTNIDFHKQELANCIKAQDYKQAAIHFITLSDIEKENPQSAATNFNLEKEEKEKIMKEIREVEIRVKKWMEKNNEINTRTN